MTGIDSIDVDLDLLYVIQKFRDYETIIFYRPSQSYVVENILPRGTAQALHPMPFPSQDRLNDDHKEQIYNAAWNGLLLGYPERFVTSYCSSFHNDLSTQEKMKQFQKAKYDLGQFLKNQHNKMISTIKLGTEKTVSGKAWEMVESVFLHRNTMARLF